MEPQTLQHLFEPFFTTKPPGQGTGLGLSVVHGVVTQNDGHLCLTSQLGKGTEVRVYFPAVDPGLIAEATKPKAMLGGAETLLLAEDNEDVRSYLLRVLEACGYRVSGVSRADEALSRLATEAFHLLITDIVMPEVSGVELAHEARILRPGMPVLFISGYSAGGTSPARFLEGEAFIQKPFAPEDLAAKVREVLNKGKLRARILIVDDEQGVRSFFKSVLERVGYEIKEASNGQQALKAIDNWFPDLVMTDLVMPEKEGLETIQTLRRVHPGIRLLAISGAAGGRYLPVASHMGADGVLNKPVSPEDLVEKVASVLKAPKR
jgi:CheY-like chemotaxis protein